MGAILVQPGSGGSASQFTFDSNGLSNDPTLSYDLQGLTYNQLQTALTPSGTPGVSGGDVTGDLIALTNSLTTGVGLPCGTAASGDPNCTGGMPQSTFAGLSGALSSVPVWAWLAGGGALLLVLVTGKR
jgi:hypothetical protein